MGVRLGSIDDSLAEHRVEGWWGKGWGEEITVPLSILKLGSFQSIIKEDLQKSFLLVVEVSDPLASFSV